MIGVHVLNVKRVELDVPPRTRRLPRSGAESGPSRKRVDLGAIGAQQGILCDDLSESVFDLVSIEMGKNVVRRYAGSVTGNHDTDLFKGSAAFLGLATPPPGFPFQMPVSLLRVKKECLVGLYNSFQGRGLFLSIRARNLCRQRNAVGIEIPHSLALARIVLLSERHRA